MKNIHSLIPGGAHTYSKGDDQFPSNAPKMILRGKGAYVWDEEGNKFLAFADNFSGGFEKSETRRILDSTDTN